MIDTPRPFDYVALDGEQLKNTEAIRDEMNAALIVLTACVPACAERTLAFRHLELASFYAIKAISRRGAKYMP